MCSSDLVQQQEQRQRIVEESPKMDGPREKHLPFKKRKWAMVEEDVEIVPPQPIQVSSSPKICDN